MYMCGRCKPHLRTRARTPARSTGSSASSSRRSSVSTAVMGTGQVGPATTATAATGQVTNLDGPHSNTKSPANTGVEGARNVNSQGFRPAREAARFCDFSLQRRKTGAVAAPPYVPDELEFVLEGTAPKGLLAPARGSTVAAAALLRVVMVGAAALLRARLGGPP